MAPLLTWERRAQQNPYGVASIIYRPRDVAYDESIIKGINTMMDFGQWWFYEILRSNSFEPGRGKTFRNVPAKEYQGLMTTTRLAQPDMGIYETETAILRELEARKATDSSGRPITLCGGDGKRAYSIFVPGGPFNAGNMIGFDATCTDKDPAHHTDNPLWPRPGVTGLSGKGLMLVSLKTVSYGLSQLAGYDPTTRTYRHESHADEIREWWGAIMHELGHIFGLPHPPTWDEFTLMGAWFDFLKYPSCPLLLREIDHLWKHLFFK
jgi:hypothetical protein